jgi:Tfp pilus assembly protein PilF
VWVILTANAPTASIDGPAEDYRHLVDAYRHQDPSAMNRVIALTSDEVNARAAQAIAHNGWTAEDLRAAAMLHTDAALQLLSSHDADRGFVHLTVAMRLIDATAARDLASHRFASLWYAHVTGALAGAGAPVWARQLDEQASSVVSRGPGDAEFRLGLEFEAAACEQDAGPRTDEFGMRVSAPLRSAATLFESALRADGSLYTAALHLGRVRLLQGSLKAARENLQVASRSTLAAERYVAHMYLGALSEQNGSVDDAERQYREAILEYKWGQSGPLALAQLLKRTNREAEARAVIARLFERRDLTVEPLWVFLVKPGPESRGVIHLLRAEIWQ